MRFHQHIHEMEALAELAFNDRRIPRIGIGAGKASAPFDDVDGSAEPRLGQKGGRDTALGCVRSLNAFSGGAGIVELCDAAGIAARQSDGFLDSPAGIAAAEDEPRRSRSRPEYVTGSGALETAPEMAGLQREADPDDRLVTRHDRGQHLRSGLTDVLSRRQRGRPHRHARMQHRPDGVSSASKLEPNVTFMKVACCGLSVLAENRTCEAPSLPTRPMYPRAQSLQGNRAPIEQTRR